MVEHPSVVRTMSTGYPQPEPIQLFKCINCGIEIYEKESYVEHGGNAFCEYDCLNETMKDEGNLVWRVAGE